jgi:hypothetical protein
MLSSCSSICSVAKNAEWLREEYPTFTVLRDVKGRFLHAALWDGNKQMNWPGVFGVRSHIVPGLMLPTT